MLSLSLGRLRHDANKACGPDDDNSAGSDFGRAQCQRSTETIQARALDNIARRASSFWSRSTHTLTRCVIDRVGDGRRDTDNADLAQPLDSHRVDDVIRLRVQIHLFGSLHAITRTTWAALLLESVMKAIHTAAMVSAIALSR